MFYKPINVLYMKKLILTLLGILFLSAFSAFADVVTVETFSAVNGNLDDNISYTTAQNGGTVAPKITNQQIYLYQPGSGKTDGGSITLSANNDCTINSITIGSSMATNVKYSIDNGTEVKNQSISKNGKLTVPNINATSVKFTCTGSSSSARFYVNYISVTYTPAGPAQPTITLSFGENAKGSVNVDETLTLPEVAATVSEGTLPELIYTYTSDKPEVATVENGVVTGVAAGEATITATCVAEGYKVKDATYTVTVIDPNAASTELNATFFNVSGTSYTAYTQTDAFNISYSAVCALNNSNMQFNNNSSGKARGIVVTANNTNYIIKSITVDWASGTKKLSVYSSNETFAALSPDAAAAIPESAVKVKEISSTETIDINAKAFGLLALDAKGAFYISNVTVNYALAGDPTKTTPKLSFAETEVVEEFVEGKTLAVQVPTSDTEGLSYTYTSSDPAVATVEGETITLVGTGSTTITVTSAESETLNSATASYTLVSEMVYHSIADLLKYAKDGETVDIAFPMTVGHVGPQGKNFYVTDGEGYMLIYNSKGITMPAYENLDVIPAGWTATCKIYGGLPELVPTTAPAAAAEKGTYTFETIDAASWTAQPLNKIVIVDNVEFTTATSSSKTTFTGKSGETEITFYNNFELAAEDAGTYKVTAVVSYFNGGQTTIATEANQLAPISFSAQPTEAVITPTPENDEIKVKAGDVITFTFANASKLEVVIETEEAPESESAPVLKATAEPITVEGDTYKYTVPDQVLNTIITVTPYNAEGEKLADRAASVMLVNADTTGVIDVTVAGEGEVEYFNLQGVRVANPESGLYIRRQGNQVSKVYLR